MISGKYWRGVRLERCDSVSGVELSNVLLDNCYVEPGPPDICRPSIRDVRVRDLTVRNCHLTGARLENVCIDGLNADRISSFLFANEFVNVQLSGAVGPLVVNMLHSTPALSSQYQQVLREVESRTNCTLDISLAEGEIYIRGYSPDKIRRDAETQAIVRLENVLGEDWSRIDFETTPFEVVISEMLQHGWPGVVLIANKRSREFGEQMRVIRRLRDAGVADLL